MVDEFNQVCNVMHVLLSLNVVHDWMDNLVCSIIANNKGCGDGKTIFGDENEMG